MLVETSGKALLCDFGLARLKADAATRTPFNLDVPQVIGSRNWMAPELLTGSRYWLTSDVYAFGMTVYEASFPELTSLNWQLTLILIVKYTLTRLRYSQCWTLTIKMVQFWSQACSVNGVLVVRVVILCRLMSDFKHS